MRQWQRQRILNELCDLLLDVLGLGSLHQKPRVGGTLGGELRDGSDGWRSPVPRGDNTGGARTIYLLSQPSLFSPADMSRTSWWIFLPVHRDGFFCVLGTSVRSTLWRRGVPLASCCGSGNLNERRCGVLAAYCFDSCTLRTSSSQKLECAAGHSVTDSESLTRCAPPEDDHARNSPHCVLLVSSFAVRSCQLTLLEAGEGFGFHPCRRALPLGTRDTLTTRSTLLLGGLGHQASSFRLSRLPALGDLLHHAFRIADEAFEGVFRTFPRFQKKCGVRPPVRR